MLLKMSGIMLLILRGSAILLFWQEQDGQSIFLLPKHVIITETNRGSPSIYIRKSYAKKLIF